MKDDILEYKTVKSHKDFRNEVRWTTGDGRTSTIARMESSHLVNLILYLKKKKEDLMSFGLPVLPMNGRELDEWFEILGNEVKYRGLNKK